jgi:hypothetical protein
MLGSGKRKGKRKTRITHVEPHERCCFCPAVLAGQDVWGFHIDLTSQFHGNGSQQASYDEL